MAKKLSANFTEPASTMPALPHSIAGKAFDIRDSEAAWWLCTQPRIMQYVFDKAKDNDLIVYDAETGMWKGVAK